MIPSGMENVVVRRLTGTIGAEVEGISLLRADQRVATWLKSLIHQHCVLVIRGQFLEPEQHVHFARLLGEFMYTPSLPRNSEWPDIYQIENLGKKNAHTELWHSDTGFALRPPSYTVLAAQILPEAGGDTMFTNQMAAYDKLSEPFKHMLRGLHVEFTGRIGSSNPEEWPRAVHPLVRTIPETGRRVLYLAPPGPTARVVGMSDAESLALLRFLYEHSIAIDSMYRHRWVLGDVLVWDNRTTMHAAAHDYGDQPRLMHRIILTGEVPFEAPYQD